MNKIKAAIYDGDINGVKKLIKHIDINQKETITVFGKKYDLPLICDVMMYDFNGDMLKLFLEQKEIETDWDYIANEVNGKSVNYGIWRYLDKSCKSKWKFKKLLKVMLQFDIDKPFYKYIGIRAVTECDDPEILKIMINKKFITEKEIKEISKNYVNI